MLQNRKHHLAKPADNPGHKEYSVCHIVHHAAVAGTEKHVMLLAISLKRNMIDNHVCCFEHGHLVDGLRKNGVITKVIPKKNDRLHFIKLVFYLRNYRSHIIHSHSGGYACIAAGLAGAKRIIYTKHGIGFTPEQLKKRSFLRKMRDRITDFYVTKYIALTAHDKQIMIKILKIMPGKIEVIHNGIEPTFGINIEKKKNKDPIIGYIGRLTPQKGLRYLISAVALLIRHIPRVKVVLAGSGSEHNRLQQFSTEIGVADRIEFLGHSQNVAEVLSQIDVFVLPSVWEGFPYVLLEAMIMKKPIIATDIFGINEIVEHGRNAILVRPRNPGDLANALEDLLCHQEKAQQLGNNAYHRVLERFSLDVTTELTKNFYRSLL